MDNYYAPNTNAAITNTSASNGMHGPRLADIPGFGDMTHDGSPLGIINQALPHFVNQKLVFTIGFTALSIVFWTGIFILLYHLIRFGIGIMPKQVAAICFAGSIMLSGVVLISFLMLIFA